MVIAVQQRVVHVADDARVVRVRHAASNVRIVQHIVHAR